MRLFTEHPESVGETYTEHMKMATSFGLPMIGAGFCCLLHGIFPFWFKDTGSKCVERLYTRMVTHRRQKPLPDETTMPEGAAASVPAE